MRRLIGFEPTTFCGKLHLSGTWHRPNPAIKVGIRGVRKEGDASIPQPQYAPASLMRARIHRGASEVGGSCVELEAVSGERLLLDLGLPLWAESPAAVMPPAVAGLEEGNDGSLLGVVLSHGHPDHFGLIESSSRDVPLFAGEAAGRILGEAAFFSPFGLRRRLAGSLSDRTPLQIGPFRLTPYLVDHSAFDSYALLVSADGRRLFYSGDVRAHGRKTALFERLIAAPPTGVHVALLEGTTVGRRPEASVAPQSEQEVEERCVKLFRNTPGMALACYSPQNIDRLVSVYRAAIRSGRDLVLDLYAAAVVRATGNKSIPQPDWKRVRVYVPISQRVRIKRSEQFWRVDELGASRIYVEELSQNPQNWVMSTRASMLDELERGDCLGSASALWMMWPGYLENDSGRHALEALDRLGIGLDVVHASGHAPVVDLQRLATALNANPLVPIHTDAPERFVELFERVRLHADGEWWEV